MSVVRDGGIAHEANIRPKFRERRPGIPLLFITSRSAGADILDEAQAR
jgi:hypothetical protein